MARGKGKEVEELQEGLIKAEKAAGTVSNEREARRLRRTHGAPEEVSAPAAAESSRKRPAPEAPAPAAPQAAAAEAELPKEPAQEQIVEAAAAPSPVSHIKKKGRPRKQPILHEVAGEEEVLDEHGNKILIPAKHGTPVLHTRPKSGNRVAHGHPDPSRIQNALVRGGLINQPPPQPVSISGEAMTIRIHARKNDGDWGPADGLPTATITISPTSSLAALRQQITSHCPFLPPKAQHFFRKVTEEQYLRLDPTGQYEITLREVGYDLPGPHDIWMEIDLHELFNPLTGLPAGIQSPQQLPVPAPAPAKSPSDRSTRSKTDAGQTSDAANLSPTRDSRSAIAQGAEAPNAAAVAPAEEYVPSEATQQQAEGVDLQPQQMAIVQRGKMGAPRNRPNKRWSDQEIENLLIGCMTFGISNWTSIAERWHFEDRTTVDLKDKWRNLVKNVRDNRPMRGNNLSEEAKNRVWRILENNGQPLTPQPLIKTETATTTATETPASA